MTYLLLGLVVFLIAALALRRSYPRWSTHRRERRWIRTELAHEVARVFSRQKPRHRSQA